MNVSWDYRRGNAAGDPRVRLDPRLAHGSCFADDVFVRGPVADAFGLAPGSWDVVHVSYVPGRELRAVYRLGVPGGALVRVDFTPPGEAPRVAERARRAAADPARVTALHGLDAVAWLVPEDERLPGLEAFLADPAASVLRATGAPPGALGPLAVLSYVPRRRAVVRISGKTPMVAKLGRMRDEGDCHARQVALAERAGGGFRLPRPIGHDPVAGARFEELVAGTSVEDLVDAADLDQLLRDVAAAIVALHGQDPLPGIPWIGSADLLAHLEAKTLTRLTGTLPDLAARIDGLARRLRATEPARPAHSALLHGDFHPGNLVVAREGPVFIDLDNLATGPRERDLGIFAGRLVLFGLKDGGRSDEITAAALRLPDIYERAGGTPVDDGTFRWYLAASVLARQISNGVRRLAPGLPLIADRLLDVAEEQLFAVSR